MNFLGFLNSNENINIAFLAIFIQTHSPALSFVQSQKSDDVGDNVKETFGVCRHRCFANQLFGVYNRKSIPVSYGDQNPEGFPILNVLCRKGRRASARRKAPPAAHRCKRDLPPDSPVAPLFLQHRHL